MDGCGRLGVRYALLTLTDTMRNASWPAVRRRFIAAALFGSLVFVGSGVGIGAAVGSTRGAIVSGVMLGFFLSISICVGYLGLRRKYTTANEHHSVGTGR